jgi:hypothetical protein
MLRLPFSQVTLTKANLPCRDANQQSQGMSAATVPRRIARISREFAGLKSFLQELWKNPKEDIFVLFSVARQEIKRKSRGVSAAGEGLSPLSTLYVRYSSRPTIDLP